MTTISRDTVVQCPPSRVFAVLADLERLTEFSDMTVAVRNGPKHPVQVGDTFEQVVKVLGIEIDTKWEVVEVVADRLIRFEGHSDGDGRASLTHRVDPDGTGSRVTFEVEYDPPLGILGDIADKLVFERKHEHEAEQLLSRLRQLCESSTAS